MVSLRCHRAALGVRVALFSELENYTVSHKVGRGRYAHVFEGKDIKTKEKVAIKVLAPIKPSKIKR
jgi:casein kinase II subunit alpha